MSQVVRYSRTAGLVLALLLPSFWLLTQPFPLVNVLQAMAVGTLVPLIVFAVISGLSAIQDPRRALWMEWAAITLSFVCLQAYIFNTALHPDNRFNLIGGLLPNADPSMYLSLASQWQSGIRVVTPQTTRQFFPCLLAAMLWICHRDLKTIVSVFTMITGSLTFLAWHQVRLVFGRLGSILFIALVFSFYRCECVGLLRTEQLGLWFALIAVALILQGLRERRETPWNIGIFSLVMGLNTRAGAYLVIPLLILYGGWFFHRGKYGWRTTLATTGVVFVAMLLNAVCYWVFFAVPRPTSNFWLCFYGMLTGGNWVTALHEVGLDYLKTNIIARDKSLILLKADPWLVAKGFRRALVYVWRTNTFYGHPPTLAFFRDAMKWLTPIGAIVPWLIAVLRRKRAELELFVLLMFIGVLFSLPFAPPWDGGHRVFAVTDPFLYLAPVFLIALIEKGIRSRSWIALDTKNSETDEDRQLFQLSQATIVVLLIFAIFVPLALMIRPRDNRVAWEPAYCAPSTSGCPARKLPSGFQIHLIPDSGRTFVPWVRISDFHKSLDGNLEKLRAPWLLDLFNDLPEGTTIGTAFHSNFFVIATDKARTFRMSQRNPILNRKWHRIVYDNDYPIPPSSKALLIGPQPPLPGESRVRP